MPLAAPAPLALGIATSEELLDKGEIGNGHDPAVRGTLARGLFEFVEAATPLTFTLKSFRATSSLAAMLSGRFHMTRGSICRCTVGSGSTRSRRRRSDACAERMSRCGARGLAG